MTGSGVALAQYYSVQSSGAATARPPSAGLHKYTYSNTASATQYRVHTRQAHKDRQPAKWGYSLVLIICVRVERRVHRRCDEMAQNKPATCSVRV